MDATFFTNNRRALLDMLGDNALIILTGYTRQQRASDSAFRFQQEANFYYLSGISEPDWLLVIDGSRHQTYLVAPTTDAAHAVFDGVLSVKLAQATSGVDTVIDIAAFRALLPELVLRHKRVHTLGPDPHRKYFNFAENPAQKRLTARLRRYFSDMRDCRSDLARLRAIKQPAEIQTMKAAVDMTVEAFSATKQRINALHHEYEIEAEFDYYFKQRGADHAYDPIVAHAQNACTLHYQKNTDQLTVNHLTLIDIGAQFGGYAADITRTFAGEAVSGRAREVHRVVAEAHQEIIGLLQPGLAITDYLTSVDTIMQAALAEIGLEHGGQQYRRYFPHAISHGLGLDPHESLGGAKEFQPGMVLTVEPGIYIVEESIGVRIEDDILITDTGHENLSGHLSTAL